MPDFIPGTKNDPAEQAYNRSNEGVLLAQVNLPDNPGSTDGEMEERFEFVGPLTPNTELLRRAAEVKKGIIQTVAILDALAEGVELGAEQVQDKRIEFQEQKGEMSVGALFLMIFFAFALEFGLIGVVISWGFKSLLRSSQAGYKIAQRVIGRVTPRSRSRVTGVSPRLQEKVLQTERWDFYLKNIVGINSSTEMSKDNVAKIVRWLTPDRATKSAKAVNRTFGDQSNKELVTGNEDNQTSQASGLQSGPEEPPSIYDSPGVAIRTQVRNYVGEVRVVAAELQAEIDYAVALAIQEGIAEELLADGMFAEGNDDMSQLAEWTPNKIREEMRLLTELIIWAAAFHLKTEKRETTNPRTGERYEVELISGAPNFYRKYWMKRFRHFFKAKDGQSTQSTIEDRIIELFDNTRKKLNETANLVGKEDGISKITDVIWMTVQPSKELGEEG